LGDDHHGGATRADGQCLAQPSIRRQVERGERVVEDIEFGPFDQGPGNGQALPLPAGHIHAALRDRGIEAVRHLRHEVAGLRDGQCLPEFRLSGVGLAVEQVAAHGAGEQMRLLRHQPDAAPEQVRVELAHVHPADPHAAVGGVEEARQQVDQGGLARSGAADDRGGLPLMHGKAHVGEHRLLGAGVGEAHVHEFHLSAADTVDDGVARRAHAGLGLEHFADPVGRHGRPRDHHGHERGHHHGHQDLHQVAKEGNQGADLHGPVLDPERPEPDHGHAGDVQDEHDDREHQGHQAAGLKGGVGDIHVRLAEPHGLDVFAHERPDDADARELFPQHPVHRVDAGLHQEEQRHHPRDDQPDRDQQHGHAHGDQSG